MKIRLEREEKLDGEIWYKVWADNHCIECVKEADKDAKIMDDGKSRAYHKAIELYNKVVERERNGYPKKETILSTEINTHEPA